jgi:hypothetical protein
MTSSCEGTKSACGPVGLLLGTEPYHRPRPTRRFIGRSPGSEIGARSAHHTPSSKPSTISSAVAEARLAGASWAGKGQQPRAVCQQPFELRDLALAAHEAREPEGRVAPEGSGGREEPTVLPGSSTGASRDGGVASAIGSCSQSIQPLPGIMRPVTISRRTLYFPAGGSGAAASRVTTYYSLQNVKQGYWRFRRGATLCGRRSSRGRGRGR